jgi:hypothetical protein
MTKPELNGLSRGFVVTSFKPALNQQQTNRRADYLDSMLRCFASMTDVITLAIAILSGTCGKPRLQH